VIPPSTNPPPEPLVLQPKPPETELGQPPDAPLSSPSLSSSRTSEVFAVLLISSPFVADYPTNPLYR
jgi:hypothetical protein